MLESGWSIGETEGHNTPLKGIIAGTEGSLPFVPFMDLDKVVCVPEINLREKSGLTRAIQDVGDTREWITVFLCDLIEAPEVDAKSQGAILLLDE